MKNESLVSVITPAYNCEKTIESTIKSVIQQTYKNWEMIIVNDCSTDGTEAIIKKYIDKDTRIKYIKNEKNMGSADSRNRAILDSKGRYIALLDSDDLWMPDKLTRQVAFMEDNKCAFSYTSYAAFKVEEKNSGRIFEAIDKIDYNQYIRNTIIGCLTVMVDIEQVRDFHMEKGYLEDVLTWMFYLERGYVFYGIKECLARYRVMSGTKSSNKVSNSKRYYECLKHQNIGFFRRIYSYLGYIYNALKKRIFSVKE